MLTCEFGDKIKRDAGRVRKRLVHMVLNLLDVSPEFFGGNHLVVMVDADMLRQALCPVDLVVFFPKVKADSEGLLIGKIGGNVAGIHAA